MKVLSLLLLIASPNVADAAYSNAGMNCWPACSSPFNAGKTCSFCGNDGRCCRPDGQWPDVHGCGYTFPPEGMVDVPLNKVGHRCVSATTPPTPAPPPVPTPTKQPVPAPTKQPVPAPTEQPVPAPTKQPVPAPTKQPVPAPTKQLTPNNGACFHGNGTVLLESGSSKRFSELSLGERIKTYDAEGKFSFTPIKKLPHANNNEPAAFLTLKTETGKEVDMTSDHYIPKCDLKVVTAGELVVGDCLLTADGKETLIEISWTEKYGVYSAVTEDTFFVVDGVVASPFSKDSHPEEPDLDYEKYRTELERMVQDKVAYMSRKASKQKGKLAYRL